MNGLGSSEPLAGTGAREVPVVDPAWRPLVPDFAASTIGRRFEERADDTPDALAIVGPSDRLTYRELDRRANQIAHAVEERADPLGRPVALLLPHDVDLVVAIMATFKVGGIVLVLDPLAPVEVSAAVLRDAAAAVVVTVPDLIEAARSLGTDGNLIVIDQGLDAYPDGRLAHRSRPDSPAMLAYTSGTTSGPRAAVIPHQALLHLTLGAADTLRLTARDRLPMLFPVSMAVAAYPMLLPLLVGGSLHIRDLRSVGLVGFEEWLRDQRITVLYLSPTVVRFLDDPGTTGPAGDLRLVVLGGERVDGAAVDLVRRTLGADLTVANGYGTTETGVLTFYVVGDDEEFGPLGVPAGRPIKGMDLEIVGDDGRTARIGAIGELIVRSAHLFSGYWGRPDLDASVLSSDQESHRSTYRTGDLGLIDDHGNLQLVGRSDSEVKVSGHRVVPGEVEQALLALAEVSDAVVEPRADALGGNELVAWVVPAGDADVADIRSAAVGAMRAPFVPARFVLLATLPQLPNGKLDRRALPAPSTTDDRATAPRTETERVIARLFARILAIDPVGVDTDLASLGAQSLDLAWAVVRIEEDLGVRLQMGRLVDARTVADIARAVDQQRRIGVTHAGLIRIQGGEPARPTLFMVHDLHGSAFGLRHLAPRLGTDQPLWGFESPFLDGPRAPFRTLDELATHYASMVRASQPNGPVHLAGYSFGGVLAFEIARQLVAEGAEVAFLGVVDVGPGYRGRHYDPRKVLDKPWSRVAMPPEDATRSEQARWYAHRFRSAPVDAALSLSMRSGLDRWTDPLLFEYDLRRHGQIAPGRRLWYAWRKQWELARSYEWSGRTYPGSMTLVWADESASTDGTMGWGDVVEGPIDIVHVPVPHERFLLPDGADVLGPVLRRALDSASRRAT